MQRTDALRRGAWRRFLGPLLGALLCAGPGPEAGEAPRVSVLAGGDVTLGAHLPEFLDELRQRGERNEAALRGYPFRRIGKRTRRADIFWINLEGALTHQTEKIEKNFSFRADPAAVRILVQAGVDVACLANNHAFDFGARGLQETLDTLRDAGIAVYGAGRDLAAARRPALVERHGVSLGFIGYVYLGPASIEPAAIYATAGTPGVAGTHGDADRLAGWVDTDVRALRERVDVVLVSFHWGREGSHVVLPYQRRLARVAARAGADLIVGHHPHALQGSETIGRTFVAYSLGNLMFAGNWNPTFKDAALLEMQAAPAEPGGAGHVVRFLPIAVDDLPEAPFQPWFRTGDDARRVLRQIDCYSGATADGECDAGGLAETPEPRAGPTESGGE